MIHTRISTARPGKDQNAVGRLIQRPAARRPALVRACQMATTGARLTLTRRSIGGCPKNKWEEIMKFRFALAIVVASTVMTQGNYAYALDCKATNLTKQEQGVCALRAATAAGAKVAPSTTTTTNRCAGQAGQALIDCKSFNLASCIPLPAGAAKTECMALYGG